MKHSQNPSIADLVRVSIETAEITRHVQTTDARRLVDAFLEEVAAQVLAHGRTIRLPHFGTFSRSTTKARQIRDLVTGEIIQLPATFRLNFRASKFRKGAL